MNAKKECKVRDFRCLCGSLMAKIIPTGIEIKCRRCKRIHYIPAQRVQVDEKLHDQMPSTLMPVSVKGGSYA